MRVIWNKVWRDLVKSKSRTFLAVLSTAVGVFALGLVFGLSTVMSSRMTEDHQARLPPHITFWGGVFGAETIDAVEQEPGVVEAEGETQVSFRWKQGPDDAWRPGDVIARGDYPGQRLSLVNLEAGRWPSERTLALERQSSRYLGIPVGSTIIVEFGRGERRLPLEGVIRSPTVTPPQFGGDPTFYATPETVAWLTGFDAFNLLRVRLESFSEEGAEVAAQRIEARLDRMGTPVGGYLITDPDVHWMQDQVDTLSLILGVLGALSLGLGAFLIVNTMNAIVAQEVWQIGVMKAVGATSGRVMMVYLMGALTYGLLACLIAVPLGVVSVHGLGGWLLDLINVENGPIQVVPSAVGLQALVGLTVPVVAALVPVVRGARISPQEAIRSYGLGAGFGRTSLDRLIARIRHLPRPLALSLRNTFRRKGRVALTLLTLILAGIMFIMVMSVRTSLDSTLETVINELGLDVWVVFDEPERRARLIEIAESVPGVALAEVWEQQGSSLAVASGEEKEVYLLGLPVDSQVFEPNLVEGRTFLPGDHKAILINNKIAEDEGIQVGDEIQLTVDGAESSWTVIGLILSIGEGQQNGYVPFDALTREIGSVNRGTIVMVVTGRPGVEEEQALIRDLREAYTDRGAKPSFLLSASEVRRQNRNQFNIITYLMLAMAVLAAVVGAVGMMGMMSINVIERTREIGVMRAVGAGSWTVIGILVIEGVFLGLVSWILAAPASYPGARAFSNVVGSTLIQVPLDFSFSVLGVALWLLIVVLLSALGSLWPALRAVRVSVRDALAYE